MASKGPDQDDFERETEHMELDCLAEEAGAAKKHIDKDKVSAWRNWVATALERGARKAHQFTQEAVRWKAQTTVMEHGKVTADPLQLLIRERALWKKIWRAADDQGEQGGHNEVRKRVRAKLGRSSSHLPLLTP